MKTLKFLLASAVALMAFAGCSSEEEPLPYLWVSTSKFEIPYYGGTYDFSYAATPDGSWEVECESSVEWITDVTASSENVSFSVPYTTLSSRTGYIYIKFSGDEGVYSWRVTVSQDAGVTPTIETQSASITTTIDGGTYEMDYSIINSTPDGEISITADDDWIGNIDWSADGSVSFSVAENEGDALREANINIFYTYSEGESNVAVKIIQPFNSGGSFDGTVASIIGTYEAEGKDYNFQGQTWTMTITEEEGTAEISTLIPKFSKSIEATLKPEGKLVVSVQFFGKASYSSYYDTYTISGLALSMGYDDFLVWPSGTGSATGYRLYNSGPTYWYSSTGRCTFTYDSETDSWESDAGLIYGDFKESTSPHPLLGFSTLILPFITIKRVNDSVSTSTNQE